jgi:fructokinase
MASVLGDEGVVASRIGNDDLGREAYGIMQELGMNASYVQHDDLHETGTARVSIDAAGQPNFTIKESVSWDFLQWTPAWEELSARADVVCFGSLGQRSSNSAATIECFLRNTGKKALRICDVNLRQAFYNREVLLRSFQHAQVVKLNEQEILQVSFALRLGIGSDEMLARRLLNEYGLRLICITRGSRGSLLVSENETVEHPGYRVKVADAIGAGDAFTACLAGHYFRGHSLEEISDSANRFASWVASQTGATPRIAADQLQNILSGHALQRRARV